MLREGARRRPLEALFEDIVGDAHGLGVLRGGQLGRIQVGIRADEVWHGLQGVHARKRGRMEKVRVVPLATML